MNLPQKSIILLIIVLFGCGVTTYSETIENTSIPVTFHQDGEVRTFMDSGTPGVNLVILGDGFIQDDLKTGGEYDQVAEELAGFILRQNPFEHYQNHFNVYIIYAVSQERGADSSPYKNDKNTVFNSTFGANGIGHLLVVRNTFKILRYLSKAKIRPDILLISVNSSKHGGNGGFYTTASRSPYSKYTALHEIGHAFANLADEYEDESVAAYYKKSNIPNYCNVDLTGDIDKVKWGYFNGIPGYETVGVYEGGYYRSSGVWRPQQDCIMRSNNAGFCNVCRLAIVKKIYWIIKEKFSFTEFLEMNDPNDMKIK